MSEAHVNVFLLCSMSFFTTSSIYLAKYTVFIRTQVLLPLICDGSVTSPEFFIYEPVCRSEPKLHLPWVVFCWALANHISVTRRYWTTVHKFKSNAPAKHCTWRELTWRVHANVSPQRSLQWSEDRVVTSSVCITRVCKSYRSRKTEYTWRLFAFV